MTSHEHSYMDVVNNNKASVEEIERWRDQGVPPYMIARPIMGRQVVVEVPDSETLGVPRD